MKTTTEAKTITNSRFKIKGFNENSLINWNGKISAVIFLSGCNFACPFCHNSSLAKNDPNIADISPEFILEELAKKKAWLDGVVITGGEPCLYHDLFDFIKKIKDLGFKIKLDTNGYKYKVLETLIKQKLVDYIAMDIKAPLNEKYNQATGKTVNISQIMKSIELLQNSGIDYEFRTTFVPNLLNKDDLVEIANYLKGSKRYYIQQFKPTETMDLSLNNTVPYPNNYLDETKKECMKYIPNSHLRD